MRPDSRAAEGRELGSPGTWRSSAGGDRGTALEDLFGVPPALVNDNRLSRALDRLLPHKDALQQHLVARLGELFALDYDLLLYDVTSVYFEGAAEANPLAQRGHSRDHRPDCKQALARRDSSPARSCAVRSSLRSTAPSRPTLAGRDSKRTLAGRVAAGRNSMT